MSITQTPNGWMFTQGSQTYGPFPTREQACEVAYDLERGQLPASPEQLIIEAIDRARRVSNPDADVAEMIGIVTQAAQRQDKAEGRQITDLVSGVLAYIADDDSIPDAVAKISYPVFLVFYKRIEALGLPEHLEDAVTDQLANLADVLTCQATVAMLADAWAAGAALDRITVKRRDDLEVLCTDYRLDGATVEVLDEPDDGRRVSVIGDCLTYKTVEEAEAEARGVLTLLNDPRVKAAIAADRGAA